MAQVTRTLEHKVNMGNYEHVVYSATVHLTETDYDGTVTADDMLADADTYLQEALAEDIKQAAANTALDDSFIHEVTTTKKKRN
jgi:hypothetical protein